MGPVGRSIGGAIYDEGWLGFPWWVISKFEEGQLGRAESSIAIRKDLLSYTDPHGSSWEVPVQAIKLIGESTNPGGPGTDDYLLCVATGPGSWLECSFYANEMSLVLEALSNILGTELHSTLHNRTDFASRVMWPPKMLGLPMFCFSDKPKRGLKGLLGIQNVDQTYTPEVLNFLRNEQTSAW